MTPALVLAAHGSRDPRFAITAERVRRAVAVALPGTAVHLAYLDLNEPSVDRTLQTVSGADTVVVPLLFSTAFHATVDLPEIIDAARAQRSGSAIIQTPTLGGDERLITALADRITDVEVRPDDGVVLCAVGSRDQAADDELERVATRLSIAIGGQPVRTLFATRLGADGQNLRAAVDELTAQGALRIVLSPYFLSAGTLTDRVENALDRMAPTAVVAPPMGAHTALIEIVCDRYRVAVGHRATI